MPVYRILNSLKTSGYEGYISLEYEGMEETVTAMEIGAEKLKRMLADINEK